MGLPYFCVGNPFQEETVIERESRLQKERIAGSMGMTSSFDEMNFGLEQTQPKTPSSIDMFETAKPIVSTSNESASIDFVQSNGLQSNSRPEMSVANQNGFSGLDLPSVGASQNSPSVSPTTPTQNATSAPMDELFVPAAQESGDNTAESAGKIVNSSPMASMLSLPDDQPATSPVLEAPVASTQPAFKASSTTSPAKASTPSASLTPSSSVKPVVESTVTPSVKPAATPAVTPIVTPATKSSVAAVVKAAVTPAVAPSVAPVVTQTVTPTAQPIQQTTPTVQQVKQPATKVPPPAPSKPPVISKTTTSVDAGTVSAAAKKQTIANELGLEFDDGGSGQGPPNEKCEELNSGNFRSPSPYKARLSHLLKNQENI